ncbi:hypothetical protein [Nioella aestuarii]|uniref:hypothetical protein n=1 Tax=Nioella aestuarii TaxID=1662864 RepID=UPI003D7F64D9
MRHQTTKQVVRQRLRIHLVGWSDRDMLEGWLADGLIALTLQTPRCAVVAFVQDPLSPGSDFYGSLLMQRPSEWLANPQDDPRSDLQIAQDDPLPMSVIRLESQLALQTGIQTITSVTVSLTKRAAAMVVAAQRDALGRLTAAGLADGIGLASLEMTMCLSGTEATVRNVSHNGETLYQETRSRCP